MFRVGERVVCIDDSDTDCFVPLGLKGCAIEGMDGLTKGVIYTIRGIEVDTDKSLVSCVHLEEIVRETSWVRGRNVGEIGFAACRFRPIVERKADISVFTEILRKANQRVKA